MCSSFIQDLKITELKFYSSNCLCNLCLLLVTMDLSVCCINYRMQGTASAFGGSELWRACHILRGHTGGIFLLLCNTCTSAALQLVLCGSKYHLLYSYV